MRTAFSPAQLADPDIAEAAAILKVCEHYGFCTAVCPTYVLFRDENDSPRGRIDLIRAMLERGGAPPAKSVHHLDRCLSCNACMTTCAVKVDYLHLIDRARVHIERHYRRPLGERLLRALVARTLPHPRRLGAALAAARFARPFARALPGRLKALAALAPKRLPPPAPLPEVTPAEGARKYRVLLLATCVQRVLAPGIDAATLRVLARHGAEVIAPPGAGCCGALTLHMGREDQARRQAAGTIRAWSEAVARHGAVDAVLVNASGCGTAVKDYGHLFARDPALAAPARRFASLARDVSEFLDGLDLAPVTPRRHRVAYHDACSLQHAQGVRAPPRRLLLRCGFQLSDVAEGHFCCGSAGTYNMLQPEIADALGRRKAAAVTATGADILAAGNLGCLVQLSRHLDLPAVHTVELVDWATGGPRPAALAGHDLAEVTPPAEPAANAAAAPEDAAAIW
jgi:glycolate oxidase iron-sulfur subunit